MTRKHSTTLLLLFMFQFAVHAQQTYQLDIKKSKILWNTGKMMGGHFGYLYFNSGSLAYSSGGEPLRGSFSMDMTSMRSTDHAPETADARRVDSSLRTKVFFDVTGYPASTINVKQIAKIGNSTNYKVAGDLTIKGITKPIEFIAAINTKDNTISITADIEIHRQMWNIDFKPNANSFDFLSGLGKTIADEIYISLNLVLTR